MCCGKKLHEDKGCNEQLQQICCHMQKPSNLGKIFDLLLFPSYLSNEDQLNLETRWKKELILN